MAILCLAMLTTLPGCALLRLPVRAVDAAGGAVIRTFAPDPEIPESGPS